MFMKTILAMSCLCVSFPLLAMAPEPSSPSENHLFGKPGHFYLGGSVSFSRFNTENRNPNITYYSGFLNDAYPNQNSSLQKKVQCLLLP
jgi:hypothetical protein